VSASDGLVTRRRAVAWALLGLTAAVSYAVQTLYAGWTSTGDIALPIATAHIPFYWRFALALFQGLLVGSIAFLGLSERDCQRILDRIPVLAPALILPLAGLMLVFP